MDHLKRMQSSNFFDEIAQTLNEYSLIESATAMSNSIQNWRALLATTTDAFMDLKSKVMNEKKLDKIEYAYGSFQLHAIDALRNIEGVCLCGASGYIGASFVLLRVAIERMIFGIYFIIDPAAADGRVNGERLVITGKNGIINKLNNEEFIRTKMGWKEGTNIKIFDDKLAEAITSFYRSYSTVVHGSRMETSDLLEVHIESKGNLEKGAELLLKRQKEYKGNVAALVVNFLDLFANLYYFGILLATQEQIVKELRKNECFKQIAPKFPRLNSLFHF